MRKTLFSIGAFALVALGAVGLTSANGAPWRPLSVTDSVAAPWRPLATSPAPSATANGAPWRPLSVAPVAFEVAAAAPVGAVGCINGKDPNHNVKVFWTAGRVCPAGHYGIADAFGGGGAVGPQGPKGDKGEPGDTNVVSRKASVTLTSASAAQTLTVTGLPAFTTGLPEIAADNLAARPIGSDIKVEALPVAAGDTVRKFSVSKPEALGTNSFTLTVQVVSVP